MTALSPSTVPLSGIQLIEASAGTGKTHTITNLFLRLLVELELAPDQILVVTFTNAATAELRERIRRRLREAVRAFERPGKIGDEFLQHLTDQARDAAAARRHLLGALREVDQVAVSTIHGFCQRVLSDHAFESGQRFDVELVGDVSSLISEVAQDFWAQRVYDGPPALVTHLTQRGVGVAELTTLARIAVAWPDLALAPAPPVSDPAPALSRYLQARALLAQAWPAAREAVWQILASSPALKRTLYRERSIDTWIQQLDALLSDTSESQQGWFDDLERLTARGLSEGTKKTFETPAHPFFDLCERLVDAHVELDSELDSWLLSVQHDLVGFSRDELRRRKQNLGIQSFDDLLQQLRSALRSAGGARLAARIRRRLPVALIDEFHDTDPIQYDIFRTIYGTGEGRLFLIGDPKQAIYSFRGADIFAYLRAVHDAAERWTLPTNYRSDPAMVRAVNTLFSRATAPFVFEEIRFEPVVAQPLASDRFHQGNGRAALELLFLERSAKEQGRGKPRPVSPGVVPRLVAEQVAELLHSDATIDDREIRASDIAVLTRTNQQAREIQAELGQLRITAVLHGDSSVLDTDEAREMAYVLRALAEPSSSKAVKTALSTSLLGLDANALFELRDDAAWETWTEAFHRWHEIWEHRGFVQAIRRLVREQQVPRRVLGTVGGERKLTNFYHLVELLHREASDRRLGISGLLQWFDEVRHDFTARQGQLAPEAQQIRLESDANAVLLTTMHRSKGLEYPVVYCPYLWGGQLLFSSDERFLKYHDPDDSSLKLDLRAKADKPAAIALAEREALAENLRLCYVALTRAKHHCVAFWGRFRGSERSALGYLLHPAPAEAGALAVTPAARIAHMTDSELLDDLERLVEASQGSIAVTRPRSTSRIAKVEPQRKPSDLEARNLSRSIDATHRITSFSALAQGGTTTRPERLERDVDAFVEARTTNAMAATEPEVPLAGFARGARAGELIHGIFENVRFEERDAGHLANVVEGELLSRGFDATWRDRLCEAVRDVLHTPLDETGLRLCDVADDRRLNELEFVFPIGKRAGATQSPTPQQLAGAFDSSSAVVPNDYVERLAKISSSALEGFVRGFIDLVFEHAGRFYLVDYKSNFLGGHASDYESSKLVESMVAHHYFLQYHLYAVALDRYLRARRASYDLERHFGGVFYLFIRGMCPERGWHTGVFADRPSPLLIARLCHLFGAGGTWR